MTDLFAQAPSGRAAVLAFVALLGPRRFCERVRDLRLACGRGQRHGRAIADTHAVEFAIDRILRDTSDPVADADLAVTRLCGAAVAMHAALNAQGRARMDAALQACLVGDATPLPLLHIARVARMQHERGFALSFPGFEEGASYDLLIHRDGVTAEIVCEVISAEQGKDVHRGAFMELADRIDPDLQNWLQDHPGRYLLKMTLPSGLRSDGGTATLGDLHRRITEMLQECRRSDHDPAAILRLDPLVLAGAQAEERGLLHGLRREFGPEAHLAVTGASGSVLVLAARAARENDVAASVHRRLLALTPRLSGQRPGVIAAFIEDIDVIEWRLLREDLSLEGEVRQFLTRAEAAPVIAVSCASRHEAFETQPARGAQDGELRFRNPRHPAAGSLALASAVLSTA